MKILRLLKPNYNISEKELNRILFILQLPPPVHGSSMVGEYINKSQVINTMFNCRYINSSISTHINEIGKLNFNKFFNYLSILFQTLWQLIAFKPHLCYLAITVSGIAFYKDAIIILLIKLLNIKIVYHLHNKGVYSRKERYIDNLLYQFVFKNSDAVLLSKYLYADVQSYLPEEKIHICPNGIPEMSIPPKANARKQEEIVKILFLSNLIESKGVYDLLEACSILKQKGIPFECNFIGGEGDINASQFQSKLQLLGLTNQVNYLGKRFGEEKSQAFINADIFALPTFYHYECFPLVLLEAMQYELPIVSTKEGGIQDIVEHGKTGFLVQQNNANVIAEKLEILIQNNELRCKMGNAGRKKYEWEFTLDKFEVRLMEILNKLVSK